jgi:hypothetical protein
MQKCPESANLNQLFDDSFDNTWNSLFIFLKNLENITRAALEAQGSQREDDKEEIVAFGENWNRLREAQVGGRNGICTGPATKGSLYDLCVCNHVTCET